MKKSYKIKDKRESGIYLYERLYEYDPETKRTKHGKKRYIGKLDENGEIIKKDTLLSVRKYRFNDFIGIDEKFPLLDKILLNIDIDMTHISSSHPIPDSTVYDYVLEQPSKVGKYYIAIHWDNGFKNFTISATEVYKASNATVTIKNSTRQNTPTKKLWYIKNFNSSSIEDIFNRTDNHRLGSNGLLKAPYAKDTDIQEIGKMYKLLLFLVESFKLKTQCAEVGFREALDELSIFLWYYLKNHQIDSLFDDISYISNCCICIFPEREEIRKMQY